MEKVSAQIKAKEEVEATLQRARGEIAALSTSVESGRTALADANKVAGAIASAAEKEATSQGTPAARDEALATRRAADAAAAAAGQVSAAVTKAQNPSLPPIEKQVSLFNAQESAQSAIEATDKALTALGIDAIAGRTPATNVNSSCESETNKWKCWIDRAVDLFDDFYFSNTELTFQLKEDKKTSFEKRAKDIVDKFDSVINSENVNKYEEYDQSYASDKYGLWREGESFTPILYLAKASPMCAKVMLLILLKKGADLTLLASTKGCLFKRKCTSVGKLARKFYNYYINGTILLVPKTIEMYKALKELSMGEFNDLNGIRTFRNF
jgi:hypothetical protein